jgi:arginase family enzyme
MALLISEIGIRMAIGEATGPGAAPGNDAPSPAGLTDAQREALVRECVRSVLATLNLMERR